MVFPKPGREAFASWHWSPSTFLPGLKVRRNQRGRTIHYWPLPHSSPQGRALAAAAAVLLIRYRVSSVWLILAGGAIGVLDHYLR